MKNNTPILKLSNVSKRFGKNTAVRNLDLEIRSGEIFGLLGPNGAGKTTTIRMIVGLIAISEGEILINGASIQNEFRKAIAHVGAVVENPKFYGFLSGYKNLVHFANLFPGVSVERIEESIDLVGLRSRIDDKVRTYSLGMRQRLGLAQAILNRPSILILDEPNNGLDPSGIKELRGYLRLLSKHENVSVVVSSHLLNEMELLCDRVAFIKDGSLLGVRDVGLPALAQKNTFTIDVDRSDIAAEEIRKGFPEIGVQEKHQRLKLKSDRKTIAEIAACLVQAGISIYGIRPQADSLETIFMEITN